MSRLASLPTVIGGLRPALARHGFAIVVGVALVGFAIANPSFLSPANLLNIVSGAVIPLIVGLAMTLVVALGAIDLSVGVALDFGSAFAIVALKDYGAPWYVAVLTGISGGALVGLVNALVVVRLRVSPFLGTLGVFFIGGQSATHLHQRRRTDIAFAVCLPNITTSPLAISGGIADPHPDRCRPADRLFPPARAFGVGGGRSMPSASRAARPGSPGLPVGAIVAFGFVAAGCPPLPLAD